MVRNLASNGSVFVQQNSKQLLKIGEWNKLHDHRPKPKDPNFDVSKKRKDPYKDKRQKKNKNKIKHATNVQAKV